MMIIMRFRTLTLGILVPLLSGCASSLQDDIVTTEGVILPPSVEISVPFSPQAPFANWDDPYQEACEEMSLIMVHHYRMGTPLSRENAESELLALIAWEQEHGYPQDVTLRELMEIAREYYGYQGARILPHPTAEELMVELAAGNPVIVPAAGRMLKNPYFSGEGPWYHMLVLTGYDSKRFVTNDPGTRRGEGYTYTHTTLLNAVHDWTGVKEDIAQGASAALVVR
ncbi:hypothetical protein COU80_05415 [Candidatus Peregrinibacteria bacterium CG10_big_fil_rev_8_21_14_0_10_55_24]|nr:MAG: hypothetical protein COU80_05415 [Candidatus Peregrinibacteria bacterium CG10_big_fil_rev_8_21_14_0_10_55_24]